MRALTRRKRLKPGIVAANHESLADLRPGEVATVVHLDFEGQERWRLEDLGLLPGTRVVAELVSPMGDTTAYRIRGSLIALRKEQGQRIYITREEDHHDETDDSSRL